MDMTEAWVTLTTNDTYALGALVLGRSLRNVGTRRILHIMVTPSVSTGMSEILSRTFDHVSVVDVMDSKDKANLALINRPDLGVTFTKLHCWRLTEYKKCVFVDADCLVMQNCDDLFNYEEFSAAPDIGWPDMFNSGVFVFAPSNETYIALVEHSLHHGSFDGGDQGLLNSFFNGWTNLGENRLPFVYNVSAAAVYTYLAAYKRFEKDVKIVHFLGAVKPWHHKFDIRNGQLDFNCDSASRIEHVQQWWQIFAQFILPTLPQHYVPYACALPLCCLQGTCAAHRPAPQPQQQQWIERYESYPAQQPQHHWQPPPQPEPFYHPPHPPQQEQQWVQSPSHPQQQQEHRTAPQQAAEYHSSEYHQVPEHHQETEHHESHEQQQQWEPPKQDQPWTPHYPSQPLPQEWIEQPWVQSQQPWAPPEMPPSFFDTASYVSPSPQSFDKAPQQQSFLPPPLAEIAQNVPDVFKSEPAMVPVLSQIADLVPDIFVSPRGETETEFPSYKYKNRFTHCPVCDDSLSYLDDYFPAVEPTDEEMLAEIASQSGIASPIESLAFYEEEAASVKSTTSTLTKMDDYEDRQHQLAWESGCVDYRGRDSWENIQKYLDAQFSSFSYK